MPLNSAALATQEIKAHIAFHSVECAGQICAHSAGSFNGEKEMGYGMRVAVYMRFGKRRSLSRGDQKAEGGRRLRYS
eukprot:3801836-Pyramimonas_sp.AAC.1